MSLTRSLTKLVAIFRKDEIDCELDAEIRSHLAMEVEENVENGMDPEQARRAANQAFGHVGLTQVVLRHVARAAREHRRDELDEVFAPA